MMRLGGLPVRLVVVFVRCASLAEAGGQGWVEKVPCMGGLGGTLDKRLTGLECVDANHEVHDVGYRAYYREFDRHMRPLAQRAAQCGGFARPT